VSTRSNRCADKFLLKLLPDANPDSEVSGPVKDIRDIVRAAFRLYALEWGGRFDIRDWVWPFNVLAGKGYGDDFNSNEPWKVLFKRAVELSLELDPKPTAVTQSRGGP
jgi:hypothetical protein